MSTNTNQFNSIEFPVFVIDILHTKQINHVNFLAFFSNLLFALMMK